MRATAITGVQHVSVPPDGADGMSSSQAARLLLEHGPNEPAQAKRTTVFRHVLPLLGNPLAIILVGASAVSASLGHLFDAALIATMVALGVGLNVLQTYRARVTIERLRSRVAPTATVRRDGAWGEIARREVVPGDVIRLCAGDLVPADARLTAAKDLHVNEAALTGESLPVEKHATGGRTDEERIVRLGSSVVSGTATALVVATGAHTLFGDIAQRVAARPDETEFERGTRRFGVLIMKTVVALVLIVVLLNVMLRRGYFESLLFAIALAVGLTPEFLPMITAVTLSRGAAHMAKQNVIVKRLSAMQNFGSIDVLCSDKTGTLTTGTMALASSLDPLGAESERPLALAYANSYHETGIRSPLDAAILAHPSASRWREVEAERTKLDEVPFDFERRRLTVVVAEAGAAVLVTKGAPESVMSISTHVLIGDAAEPLDEALRARCRSTVDALSDQGFRVLAVARRDLPMQRAYAIADEQAMTLVGLIAFVDPPLPGVADCLRALRDDGVVVKILTGDDERVARHVCREVGLDDTACVTGEELGRMTEAALATVAERTVVFARVSPAQKSQIISALKSRSHVVGFLGDGINDAPSLHIADVGISVASAVDVAKDAADIILLTPGLRSLHIGIVEGRRAFGNVVKYLLMGTSSNFGNMFSMAIAPLAIPFLPMLPTQILLNNFLYDLAQITIPTDRVDPSFTLKPRKWDISLIRNFMLAIGPISSLFDFMTFGVLLRMFRGNEAAFHTGWFVESLATQTLVVFVVRTAGSPLSSRPSPALAATVAAVVACGAALPFSRLGAALGFVPLPWAYFAYVAVATTGYLALVEVAKRVLMRRALML
jgi:Mg2+-importing ATPase